MATPRSTSCTPLHSSPSNIRATLDLYLSGVPNRPYIQLGGFRLDLLVQPEDGIAPIIKAINHARTSVEVVIFRCDRPEVEKALASAVERGVFVHALIAHTNRNGEKNLRELELRLLAAGVTVARTANDLVRYHDKLLIIDRRKLFLLAFNFTYLDMKHSRSFGTVTANRQLVQEAVRLFEADTKRQPYTAGLNDFVVSPLNARRQLTSFIKKAKKELLIYDPNVSDPAMIRVLGERAAAGVDVRIIGRLSRKTDGVAVRDMSQIRLHARTMIRDARHAFIGSQSLRAIELDARREVGIIFRDAKAVSRLSKMFDADWEAAAHAESQQTEEVAPAAKVAKKVAKAVVKELPPVAPVVDVLVKEVAGNGNGLELDAGELEQTVNEAVKNAVKQAVKSAVENAVEQSEEP